MEAVTVQLSVYHRLSIQDHYWVQVECPSMPIIDNAEALYYHRSRVETILDH